MSDADELANASDDDEQTAVVQLGDLRSVSTVAVPDRHLLIRVEGDEIGQITQLLGVPLTLGRHSSCSICLADAGVSRRHAQVSRIGDKYQIEDLGSANGTYVGSNRIQRQILEDGDVIQLGPGVTYRYSVTDADQHAMLQHLYDASVTDPLTGAFNREYFDTRLASELAYARRHGAELALLMLDIDHFKKINDTWGHQTGDNALIELVRAVRVRLRSEDVFCRYGGEEFAVILRATDLPSAARVAERVRAAVEQMRVESAGRLIPVTVSIGCSCLRCCGDPTVLQLVALADRRLYAAKAGGRNRVVHH